MMTPSEHAIVLAVACAACAQVSRIPVYNDQPQIQRCSACGQTFADPATLVETYQRTRQALAEHATLMAAHHVAVTALRDALAHWPRKAARVAVQQAVQALGLHYNDDL
jgi:hypothetical protein